MVFQEKEGTHNTQTTGADSGPDSHCGAPATPEHEVNCRNSRQWTTVSAGNGSESNEHSCATQSRSITMAMPWPPPMHMVIKPWPPPVRCSSYKHLTVMMAPLAPKG